MNKPDYQIREGQWYYISTEGGHFVGMVEQVSYFGSEITLAPGAAHVAAVGRLCDFFLKNVMIDGDYLPVAFTLRCRVLAYAAWPHTSAPTLASAEETNP